MDVKDFYYELPEDLIAQDPLEKRSNSRLMVLDKETGDVTHRHFYDICCRALKRAVNCRSLGKFFYLMI